jgi:hypothetical protein
MLICSFYICIKSIFHKKAVFNTQSSGYFTLTDSIAADPGHIGAEGEKVIVPLLVDHPVNIEYSMMDFIVTGPHEMFMDKGETVHPRADIMDAKGHIDFDVLDLMWRK